MKAIMESPAACRRILRVEVDSTEVDAEYNKIVLECAKASSVPGFRKGKAPVQLIRQRFAKDINEETCNSLIPRNYREALKAQGLSPVAVIGVSDVVMKPGQPMTFSITVDVPPEFKLPKYKGIELSGKKMEVTDVQIDKALDDLRARAATFEGVTGTPVETEHLVQMDYTGTCGGVSILEMVPKMSQLGIGKDVWARAGEGGLVPGLSAGLVGASIGETRNVSVTFPPDFRVVELAGKQADYSVTIKEVRRRVLPPIDEAFLKEFKIESIEKLREEMRAGMLKQIEGAEKARLKNEIARELIEKTSFDVPESLAEEESRRIVQDIVSDSTNRGMSREQIVEMREDILSVADKSSKDNIKLEYILDAIAAEEKLTVEESEVEKAIEDLAARYQSEKENIRQDLEKRGAMERVRRSIRVEKAFDLVIAQAKINIA
ncbi:MAG: trigger factor [bacterium]